MYSGANSYNREYVNWEVTVWQGLSNMLLKSNVATRRTNNKSCLRLHLRIMRTEKHLYKKNYNNKAEEIAQNVNL